MKLTTLSVNRKHKKSTLFRMLFLAKNRVIFDEKDKLLSAQNIKNLPII